MMPPPRLSRSLEAPLPPRRPELARLAGPSARRALTDHEADLHRGALTTVVNALGGKAAFADTLAVAGDQPEVEPILALLVDPRYDHLSLRKLCDLAGWNVADLFAAWRKAALVRAHLLAYQTITANLLPVVEDVMRRAAPYPIPCPACHGAGDIPVSDSATQRARCAPCRGKGEVLQLPDLDLQKLALELGQLVGRASGLTIQQQVNVNQGQTPSGLGSLTELQQAVRLLVGGPRTPLEVIPVARGNGEAEEPMPPDDEPAGDDDDLPEAPDAEAPVFPTEEPPPPDPDRTLDVGTQDGAGGATASPTIPG